MTSHSTSPAAASCPSSSNSPAAPSTSSRSPTSLGPGKMGCAFSSGDTGRAVHALADIGELIESGRFSPPVARTFSLAEVAKAHRAGEQGHARGSLCCWSAETKHPIRRSRIRTCALTYADHAIRTTAFVLEPRNKLSSLLARTEPSRGARRRPDAHAPRDRMQDRRTQPAADPARRQNQVRTRGSLVRSTHLLSHMAGHALLAHLSC